ncbi:hypothetical protein BDZ94DRAFT_1271103 [Collybia nuda]|uniref:CFEM domain-containing protein n=1 Tax=Collybia nuda TaxID=64659 RepID=A0A9P5XWD5_9AGAR|nr:hypothetical protein BDZ94DRAFT_1271103 [Collybia nuda]
MRFSFAILAAVVASASATALYPRQDAPSIPTCAATCLASAETGDCAATDNACLCKNDAFIASTTKCITDACKGDDLTAAIAGAQAICASVGVTLAPPTPTGGAGNGTAPTANSTGSGAPPAPTGTGGNTTTPGGNGTAPTNGTNSTNSGAAPAPTSGAVSNTLSSIAGVAALGLAALVL